MARAVMTITTMTGSYDTDGVTITGGFTAFNDTDDMQLTMTGGEILLFQTTTGTPLVTIVSVNDPFSRTGNLTKTLAVGDVTIFGPMKTTGFKDGSGLLLVDGGATGIEYMVLRA